MFGICSQACYCSFPHSVNGNYNTFFPSAQNSGVDLCLFPVLIMHINAKQLLSALPSESVLILATPRSTTLGHATIIYYLAS